MSGQSIYCGSRKIFHKQKLDQQRMMARRTRKLTFFLDFDSTCTLNDVCTLIPLLRSKRDVWEQVSKQYLDLYDDTLQKQLDSARGSGKVYHFISPLSQVEYSGVRNTIDRKCLSLISRDQLNKLGQQQRIRSDLNVFFQKVIPLCLTREACITITSANWSYSVVENCMNQLDRANQFKFKLSNRQDVKNHHLISTDKESAMPYEIPVYCNELELDDDMISTGNFQLLQIVSSEEKWQCMESELVKEEQLQHDGTSPTVIFVGDSLHDLLCLTRAHIGIILTNPETSRISSSLQRACEKLHIQLLNIEDSKQRIQQQLTETSQQREEEQETSTSSTNHYQTESKTLFIAQSWSQITSTLFIN